MTPDELREELARGTLRSAYLLAGEEALLRDDALAALRSAVLADAPADFNCDVVEGDACDPGRLADLVDSLPVMAERRLVVLREPAGRRGNKALLEALADRVDALREPAATVLVVTAARADKRARWVKAFAKPHARVECDAPRRPREVASFVRAEAARQGVELDGGAAELLAERVGPQLLLLRQEIAKVALLAGPGEGVSRDHVARSVGVVAEQPIWDLTDAIGEGRVAEALALLHRMLEQGAPPPVVLGALASHMRRLTRIRHGGSASGPPFVVRKLESQARRYRPGRLVACLRALHDADEQLKGRGAAPPEMALERLVIGLAA